MRVSNCLVEAVRAKLCDPNVKVYLVIGGNSRWHFMWAKNRTLYHFTEAKKTRKFWPVFFGRVEPVGPPKALRRYFKTSGARLKFMF